MRMLFLALAVMLPVLTSAASAGPVGYTFAITTEYGLADPFPNRLDTGFTEPDTSYIQIANTGASTFVGALGTIAVSAFAGDLSFASGGIVLVPGASVSIAMPDDPSNVGGFNGPAYQARSGVVIWLTGSVFAGAASAWISLSVADADIHSGIYRVDPLGLTTDSYVLQGGDPWGFDTGDAFELSQAPGHYQFAQPAPEPAGVALLMPPLLALAALRRRR